MKGLTVHYRGRARESERVGGWREGKLKERNEIGGGLRENKKEAERELQRVLGCIVKGCVNTHTEARTHLHTHA